jgi:subtilisin family serine protease
MSVFYKKSLRVIIFLAFLWFTGCQTSEVDVAPVKNVDVSTYFGEWEPIENQYIVVYEVSRINQLVNARVIPDLDERRIRLKEISTDMLQNNSLALKEIKQVYTSTINGFVVEMSIDEKNLLLKDDRIAYIEQDRFIPFDKPPWAGGNDNEENTSPGQEMPWGIARVNGGVNANGKVAWIIDTGIDLNHPDLNVDEARSRTFVSSGRDSKDPDDNDGHGTHVAGTIAAIDNSIGVVGVAAGATVVAVKVLGPRGGTLSDVIDGVDYVGATGAPGDVANMSLGGGASQALDDAVIAASQGGVKFVIAAGNNSRDANNYSPARANGGNIYTISAMNSNDSWASFSNWGNPPVDYCAPGVSIKSTYKDGGYATLNGTSMAAPHAAGVLLLGNANNGGTVKGDPDGNADVIISH